MMADVPRAFLSRYADKEDTDTLDDRLGRCYELGAMGQLNLAIRGWDTTLVHGHIGLKNLPHCWLEWVQDGKRVVWDPVLDECMKWSYARDLLHYRRWTTYAPLEAAKNSIDYGHPGPWGTANNDRYDKCVAEIQVLQAENCVPGCTEFKHSKDCGWAAMAAPLALR